MRSEAQCVGGSEEPTTQGLVEEDMVMREAEKGLLSQPLEVVPIRPAPLF